MAPGKRKRNERSSVDSGESRPSPHRPGSTTLAQHDRGADMRSGGGGGRRSSRGGRGGGRPPRNERRDSSDFNAINSPVPPRVTPGPMSPPPPRPSTATQAQLQAPTTTTSPAPAEDLPPPEIQRNPLPYDYSHITNERVNSWSATGRAEVVAAGVQALDDLDFLELSSIFQELVRAAIDRKIDASEAGDCTREILAASAEQSSEGSALFLDSISIIADTEPYDQCLERLIAASGVSPDLMRQILDAALLQNLGLTRATFIKAGIRQVTNLLYRQANHNLLREETEGYSKLVTELFTTSGSEPPTSEVVEDTFERVKGLIGTFDLDVGRVLDVTLDVFAAVLIKQFRFFIKFLRVSSWWPRHSGLHGLNSFGHDTGLPKWALPGSTGWTTIAEDEEANIEQREERDRIFWDRAREIGLDAFFELGGRHAINPESIKSILAGRPETDTHLDGDLKWIEATGTVPPPGNRVAAQLLGFKLRFYASEAREKDDILPANLMYLAALLIKIGFISLRDLYPHLWPSDEDMPAVRDAKMKEIAEKERLHRPAGVLKNALTTAGALADDTVPSGNRIRETAMAKPDPQATAPTATGDKEKEILPEPHDQKVQLLIHLLTIGAIPESLFILGRFPWLPEAFPEIYDLLHRILHHSINKVYEASQVAGIPSDDLPVKKMTDSDQGSALKGQVRRVEPPLRKPLRWPFPDKYDTNEGMIYRFYWDEWADNVPVCQNVDDIFTLCSTFLNLSGVNIGRDASLLSKLATIGNKSLSEDHSETNWSRWQDLLKRLLVPALSLTKSNTSVANEIYDMLRYYPASIRFYIYAEWNEGSISRLPAIVSPFSRARLETLSILKRMAVKENKLAGSLAKTVSSNPGVVFKVALSQIEAYSGLTDVFVDCAKYFTDLGYDVLIWSLLTSLGGKNRSRTQSDSALLTSRWLTALAKFTGKLFKRYSNMNLGPILQYINDQLHQGNVTDLIILEQLIAHMSGIISDSDFTDSQLLALTGGELLRRQTLINLQDKRFESTKSAKRLMRSLTGTKLASQLLISIAQHRQSTIYAVSDAEAHIKYLATMVDETQRILVQYLDFLRNNLSVDQFDLLIPSTPELMADFGLEPPLAFLIGRASYARRMTVLQPSSDRDTTNERSALNGTANKTDAEGDVDMTLQAQEVVEGIDVQPGSGAHAMDLSDADTVAASPSSSADSWHEALAPLISVVRTVLPEKTWSLLNPEFYVIFWQLSLADIYVPMDSYQVETGRLLNKMTELMKDRTDVSRPGMARREESRKALEATRDELVKESKQEMLKYERIRTRLNKEKLHWFTNIQGKYDILSDVLLEECFLPRLLLSPGDADYCFKFIKFLHSNGTPNFRTLGLYAHLFRGNRLRSMIFACTIREAENLGRFLKHILGDLAKWHSNKTVYEKEALGPNHDLPGFAKSMTKDEKPAILLVHEDFRRVVFNFHKQLNTALKACMTGTEWMHIRNAITVLKAVVEYFPAIDFMGKSFQSTLVEIAKRELKTREDLSVLANALMPELKIRETKWVMPQAFATNLGDPGQQNGVRSKSKQPAVPQSDVAAPQSALKPTAPEFKPQSSVTLNGAPTPTRAATNEVEDGEVDDAKAIAIAKAADESSASKQPNPGGTSSHAPLASASSNGQDPPPSSETVVRDSIAKAPGSVTPQNLPPSRADPGRNPSAPSVLEKPHPGLPSRPDVPFPSHFPPARNSSSRLGDRRDTHQSRMDHLGEGPRDRSRDLSNSDRRGPDPSQRDIGRPADRPLVSERERERERDSHESKRRAVDSGRESRDHRDNLGHRDRMQMDGTRLPDINGRLSRNDDMPPPRLTAADADRETMSNPDPPINPARAAQIFGGSDLSRPDLPRMGRDEPRDRPSSRPHSPRRGDRYGGPDRDHSDARWNDRQAVGRPVYGADGPRGRYDEPQVSPAGPRGDRIGERGSSERPRDASAFQPTPPPPRHVDPDHGRLNQSSRSQPDPNYGRLNPAQVSQIPSGPSRDRSIRGTNRIPSVSQQRFEPRPGPPEPARPPTPDKLPPTGPASSRAPRRAVSAIYDTPASTPHTPAATSPTTGIHPERLRHLDQAVISQLAPNMANQTQPPLPPAPSGPAGVHPSRLQAFQNDQSPRPSPADIQTSNINASSSQMASPISAGPPSGPKGLHSGTGSSMSPNGLTAPTGPASANDRSRGPLRQLAGINSTLQQAGQRAAPERTPDRVANIRGQGSRNNLGGNVHEPPSSAPQTPNGPPIGRDGPGSGRDLINSNRASDLFPSRGINSVEGGRDRDREQQASNRSGTSTRGRDAAPGGAPRRESGRSGRRSRRNSRSRSPMRDGERERERDRGRGRGGGGGPMDDPARGEYRDRGGRGGDARDRRQGERDMERRDDGGGGGSGDKGRDGRDVLPRSGGPGNEHDWSGGGGTVGGGGRRDLRNAGDNRRNSPRDGGAAGGSGGGGSGRKRRGDEGGMNLDGNGGRNHDKRPRR